MQVLYDEGLAIHIDPESCVGSREGVGEALAGERIGQPLSRESNDVPDADAVLIAEGNMNGCVFASARSIRRGRRPWHVRTLLVRELGDLTVGQTGIQTGLVRIGKVRSQSR